MEDTNYDPGRMGFMRVLKQYAAVSGKTLEQIDIKAEVGATAGEIFKYLEGKDEVQFKDLRREMDERGPLFAAAVGWLMREDKIDMKAGKNGIKVKLK